MKLWEKVLTVLAALSMCGVFSWMWTMSVWWWLEERGWLRLLPLYLTTVVPWILIREFGAAYRRMKYPLEGEQ